MKVKQALNLLLICGIAQVGFAEDQTAATKEEAPPIVEEDTFSESEALESLLIIEGMGSVGTGFLTDIKGRIFAVTNLHVISGFGDPQNPNVSIKTVQNEKLKIEKVFGANDHDIALIQFTDSDTFRDRALKFEGNIQTFVESGDEIQVPGNSKGGGVVLWTPGEIKGIGATEIEHTAPTYSGNSGSPIIHVKTKSVVGVHTYAMPNPVRDQLESLLRENPDSAISGKTRHFAFRLDTPKSWYEIDLREFQKQSAQLQKWRYESELAIGFILSFIGQEVEVNWRSDHRLRSFEQGFVEQAQELSTGRRDFVRTDGVFDYYNIYRTIHPEERSRLRRKIIGQLHNYIGLVDKEKVFKNGAIYPFLSKKYQGEIDTARELSEYLRDNKRFLSE